MSHEFAASSTMRETSGIAPITPPSTPPPNHVSPPNDTPKLPVQAPTRRRRHNIRDLLSRSRSPSPESFRPSENSAFQKVGAPRQMPQPHASEMFPMMGFPAAFMMPPVYGWRDPRLPPFPTRVPDHWPSQPRDTSLPPALYPLMYARPETFIPPFLAMAHPGMFQPLGRRSGVPSNRRAPEVSSTETSPADNSSREPEVETHDDDDTDEELIDVDDSNTRLSKQGRSASDSSSPDTTTHSPPNTTTEQSHRFHGIHPAYQGIPPFSHPNPLYRQAATSGITGFPVSTRRPRDPTKPAPLKKYKCDLCGKAFSRSNTLVTHRRIHTGEKPFSCEVCHRAFRQPGNLTRHRLTHTSVKPYVCPVCRKAFNRASNLQTHMRTHTNFKPFPCHLCGKSFNQKVDLKIHSYTHRNQPSA